jgi:hypothetical protein
MKDQPFQQAINARIKERPVQRQLFFPLPLRQYTRLSTGGPCRASGFGRFTRQYQELTPLLTPLDSPPGKSDQPHNLQSLSPSAYGEANTQSGPPRSS